MKTFFRLEELKEAFVKRAGVAIFTSGVLAKVLSFLTSVFLVRILTQTDFGAVAFAQSVLWFFIPLMGLGAQHALLRFGAIERGYHRKAGYWQYALRWGTLLSALTLLLLWAVVPYATAEVPQTKSLVYVLGFQLLSLFWLELIKSYLRLLKLNALYARAEWLYATTLMVLGIAGAWWFGPMGYIAALVASPLVVVAYFMGVLKVPGRRTTPHANSPKSYWSYGIFVSIGSVASQLLFFVDVFLLGWLLGNEEVIAGYRAAALIPMSLLFVPLTYLSVEAVDVANQFQNKGFLINYLSRYLRIFLALALAVFLLLFFLAEPILTVVFGTEYTSFGKVFQWLTGALVGAFLLRAPFGNLLGLVGLSRINAQVSFAMLAANVLLNLWLIPKWGATGAAITTAAVIWLSGIISCLFFVKYLRGLPEKPEI